ncbi:MULTISPECIES: tetratricopeptide repeat protein [unclassified Novosphingobium]|uniref:tetratricopeptide repeat protein n=1 Tax=unclassified Novosphingobium TaxID=2644732 RepID=UPI00135B4026|nr:MULTISPECIES: tetratricopeptide repeat protein [unclassified Novosphingobium]
MWGEMLAEAAQAAQGPNPASARPLVERLLTAKPGDADALTLAGIVAQRTGRMEDALDAFRAARDADPLDAGRHQNLGVALKNDGAYEEALAAFAAALDLRPGHDATLANLGSCLIAAGRCEDALKVLAAAGDKPDALNNMGVALARVGRHDEAAARYNRSLALRPGHLETALNLIDALAASGRRDEAENLVRQVLRAQPRNLRAANQLGLMRESAGDFAGAVAALRGAFDPAAPNHALGINLARVLILAGEGEDALGVCGTLASTQPSVTTPLALSVAAFERLGHVRERDAMMALDRFVSVHDITAAPGFADMAQFNAALVAELRAHPSLTFEPEGLVTRQGRLSGDLADAETPALRGLAGIAKEHLAAALAGFAAQPADHPFLRAMPADWNLTLWGTILQPGGEVGPHIHAPNWLSGVYYPAFEGDDGAFAIGVLPGELGGGGTPVIKSPRAGRMILFPSYLWHGTLPFRGEQERISFAFDLVPAGVGKPHKLR